MAKTWMDHKITELVNAVNEKPLLTNMIALEATNIGLFENKSTALNVLKKGPFLEKVKILSIIRSIMLFDLINDSTPDDQPRAKDFIEYMSMGWISSIFGQSPLQIYNEQDCHKKAFQPSRELIERLSGLRAPKLQQDELEIFKHHIWYFDFPPHAFPQKHAEGVDENGNLIKVEVFCRAAIWHTQQNTLSIVLSVLGEPAYIYIYEEEGEMGIFHSKIIKTKDSAMNMAHRIIDMLILLVMYYHTHREETGGVITPLPHANLKSKKVLQSKKAVKGINLFKVDQLNPAEGPYLPSIKTMQSFGTNPYNHSFKVKGHFRWQPYGNGHSKRKLIWIDDFIKGSGMYQERDTIISLK